MDMFSCITYRKTGHDYLNCYSEIYIVYCDVFSGFLSVIKALKFVRFYKSPDGTKSLKLLNCQLFLACDLKCLEKPKYQELNDAIVVIKRMLTSFIKTLRKTKGRNFRTDN